MELKIIDGNSIRQSIAEKRKKNYELKQISNITLKEFFENKYYLSIETTNSEIANEINKNFTFPKTNFFIDIDSLDEEMVFVFFNNDRGISDRALGIKNIKEFANYNE